MKEYIVTEICRWNKERDNTQYDVATEFTMLTEEVQELLMARQKNMLEYAEANNLDPYNELTFRDMSDEDKQILQTNILVDEADALADVIFVAVGGLYKLTGSRTKTLKIINTVIEANEKKGKDKVDGKITKPKDFVGPEKQIREIITGELDG